MVLRTANLIILLALVIGFTLELFGPYKGWMEDVFGEAKQAETKEEQKPEEKKTKTEEEEAKEDDEEEVKETGPVFKIAGPPGDVKETPGKLKLPKGALSERQRLYRELRDKYLGEVEPYKPGEKVKIKLDESERKIEAKLIKRLPGKVKLAVDQGTVTFPAYRIDLKATPGLFPERTASIRASEELKSRKTTDKRKTSDTSKPKEDKSEQETGKWGAASEKTDTEKSDQETGDQLSAGGSTKVSYQPAPPATSKDLVAPMKKFKSWLAEQNKHLNARIIKKAYAKRQGKKAVLYLVLNKDFPTTAYKWQVYFAESVWKTWAFRMQEMGIVDTLAQAYVVFVDQRKSILGGSSRDAASNVWMQEKS